MSINTNTPIYTVVSDGNKTSFTLDFTVDQKEDLKVTVNGLTVSKNDYTFNSNTNSVQFYQPVTQGSEITIQRDTSLERSNTYATFGNDFRPESLNYDFNRIWKALQERGVQNAEALSALLNSLDVYAERDRAILDALKDETLKDINQDTGVAELIQLEAERRKKDDVAYDLLSQLQQGATLPQLKEYIDNLLGIKNPILLSGITSRLIVDHETGETVKQHVDKSVTTVESIDALIALKNPKDGQSIYVKSYHAGLGKGGGTYTYNVNTMKWDYKIDKNILSPESFGAKGVLNNDEKVFTNLNTDYIYELGKEYTVPVWRGQVKKYIGNNTKVHLDSVNGDSTVCLQIRDDSKYSDITFINNPTQQKSWSYSVIGNNSVMDSVGFYNFDDNVNPKNSWGIYLEDRKNITLNNCHFGGNGVSDIAIVDNVQNITINDARNDSEGVSLDIEPNVAGVSGININGGHYKFINILENNYTTYGIKDVNITNSTVDLLELRGGVVNVKGGLLKRIKGSWYPFTDYEGHQNEYFSSIRIDNAQLSENLIKDQNLLEVTPISSTSYWSVYAPTALEITKKYDAIVGNYIDINSLKLNYHSISMRNSVDIPLGTTHICLAVNHAVSNGQEANFNTVRLSFKNSSDETVLTLSYKGCRVDVNKDSGWISEEGIFELPTDLGIVKASVSFVCKAKAQYKIKSIGLYSFNLTKDKGNFNQVLDTLSLPVQKTSMAVAINVAEGTTNPKIANYDVPFIGLNTNDSVSITTDTDIGLNTIITARAIAKDLVRISIINFGTAINTTINVKLRKTN